MTKISNKKNVKNALILFTAGLILLTFVSFFFTGMIGSINYGYPIIFSISLIGIAFGLPCKASSMGQAAELKYAEFLRLKPNVQLIIAFVLMLLAIIGIAFVIYNKFSKKFEKKVSLIVLITSLVFVLATIILVFTLKNGLTYSIAENLVFHKQAETIEEALKLLEQGKYNIQFSTGSICSAIFGTGAIISGATSCFLE